MALIRSKDRKVANAVSPNGKTPTIANTFGLPAGKDYSCPSQTPTCAKVCYAGKLEKVYKGVRNVLMSNWEQLKDANKKTMVSLLNEMIGKPGAKCPENKKAIPLISTNGSACVSCSLCVYSKADIVFSSSKK